MTVTTSTPALSGVDLLMSDPIIEDRYKGNNRAIDFKWLAVEEPCVDDFDRPQIRRVHIVLTVQHWGKPEYGNRHPFSFTAHLGHDERWHQDGMVQMRIGVGMPVFQLPIGQRENVMRFSRKQLEVFADEMLTELRNRRDEEIVRSAFDVGVDVPRLEARV